MQKCKGLYWAEAFLQDSSQKHYVDKAWVGEKLSQGSQVTEAWDLATMM